MEPFEIQMPDSGWLNGPSMMVFAEVFEAEMSKFARRQAILAAIKEMASAAAESARSAEEQKVGQYL